ncbi:UNVERIFIED_CONTAM: hypothetical protein GTU68_038191 [Idotea baltica]|nr:hypothetical protein [Idotea baltica]
MLVLGAGPGGYTAAFRAADLGMQTVLIERWATLGGVCLNVGCIPSKALLHAAKVLDESEEVDEIGIEFKKPKVDIDKLRTWKEKIVSRLTGGLSGLAKQRKVQVVYDRVLVAVGRTPNGKNIAAENAGVAVDQSGFVQVVDSQMRTTQPHIFAIGDIIGQPMLAHKAVHEGKTAAEAASGLPSHFDARVIPSVAYTDPEIAWVGVTEEEAKAKGIKYGKGVFPWAASGRALSIGREEGMTKLIFDESNERVIGAGIVGVNAGELIAEVAHAIEMGSNAADIGLTVHPHPTLSETVAMAAEMFEGTITDLYAPKKKK